MLSIPSRFALALVPTLINAQSVTYSFTFGQEVTSVVLPAPKVETTTITVKEPQETYYLTTQLPAAVTTQTIIITAPVNQISSIAGSIPKSYQEILSEKPGAVVPFTINGYTTSIVIPASVSIPTDVSIPPFTPVVIPVATISSESAKAVSSIKALSSSIASGKSRHVYKCKSQYPNKIVQITPRSHLLQHPRFLKYFPRQLPPYPPNPLLPLPLPRI